MVSTKKPMMVMMIICSVVYWLVYIVWFRNKIESKVAGGKSCIVKRGMMHSVDGKKRWGQGSWKPVAVQIGFRWVSEPTQLGKV
jgi:hypothetical protein